MESRCKTAGSPNCSGRYARASIRWAAQAAIFNERSRNVIDNKELLVLKFSESRNVFENKAS
jgi:hypothetical protein